MHSVICTFYQNSIFLGICTQTIKLRNYAAQLNTVATLRYSLTAPAGPGWT